MTKIKLWICSFFLIYTLHLTAAPLKNEPLITIHGFFGAPWTMLYYANGFYHEGMLVTNWGYPSTEKTIESHGADLVKQLQQIANAKPFHPIYFVTHSMGGLVLRSAINHPDCPLEAKMGKAVLLAPPNQGACWGRFLDQFAFARNIAKDKAGRELMTQQNFEHLGSFPQSMEVLVVAGNYGFNPLLIDDNDGTVTVEETYLKTPHEHVVICTTHKGILINKEALALAKDFFERD